MFAKQIGKTMKVYVDDMLVKSKTEEDHAAHLEEMFTVHHKYRMKLNPEKCAFGVTSGKFLGFLVSQRGIEANPEKIKALDEMTSLAKKRDVQKLTGCIAALNRFISRCTEKYILFFDTLRGNRDFKWTDKCEKEFLELKNALGHFPILSKPLEGETLRIYLAVSDKSVSSVIIREVGGVEHPVYFVS